MPVLNFNHSAVTTVIFKPWICLLIVTFLFLQGCNNSAESAEDIYPVTDQAATETEVPVAVDTTVTAHSDCPQFPFHPPKASAFKVIPRNIFIKDTTKISVGSVLQSGLLPALESAGYEYSFYCLKDSGIAVVTRIEKIKPDGSSGNADERYLTEGNSSSGWN